MGASTSLALALVDYAFGIFAYTPDPIYYIGLSSTNPGAAGAGQTEPSGGAYARVAVTNNATNWPTGNPKMNGTEILFPIPAVSWLGGANLTYFTIWNHATLTAAANFRGSGQLSTPQPALAGNIIRFPVGTLVITVIAG
jgi:hypothetical protein